MRIDSALFFVILLFSIGCSTSAETEAPTTVAPTPTAPAAVQLQSLTDPLLTQLVNTCDQIDIIFNNEPVSLSFGKKEDVMGALRHLAPETVTLTGNCQPLGKVFFNGLGETILEADMYFSNGCTFFTFYEEGKVVYGHQMTSEGINYYNNVMKNLSTGG